MTSKLHRLKDEILRLLGVAAFFSVMFCVILLAEDLTVEGSSVKIMSYAKALVGGLIVAKVVMAVDLLPFVNRFPDRPLIYNIAWKTPIYFVGSLLFRYAEPFVKSLYHGASVAEAHRTCVEEFSRPIFWANQIWITLLLALFLSFRELTRVLGRDKVRVLLIGR